MTQPFRLARGGRINRAKPIRFWYDNKGYHAYPGDTLASALLANGVRLVARSFKYHRPRGIHSAGSEEPNALVQLESGADTEPNRRATEIEVYPGLSAQSQNCRPSVRFDLGAISAKFARLLPAGFYYKTFMRPQFMWPFYEKYIRKAAGLGRAPREIDPARYDKTHAHCDVLVVGGGAAGLQAALAAGLGGARVILVDEKSEFGGALLSDTARINELPAMEWVEQTLAQLKKMPHVKLLARTTLCGYYAYNFLVANQRVTEHLGARQPAAPKERLWKIRARRVVLACGAIERPLVFADNDRPGVMLAGAVRSYINRYAVLPGRRIVVFTNNDSAYLTALDAKVAGAEVVVVDIRREFANEVTNAARNAAIDIHHNFAITGVGYARGKITHAEIMQLSDDARTVTGHAKKIPCDLIAASGGWTPSVHLHSQSRGQLKFDQTKHCFTPGDAAPTCHSVSVGACAGEFTLAAALADGFDAGLRAARECGFDSQTANTAHAEATYEPAPMRALWVLPCEHPIGKGRKKHFHELQNDATIGDIALAAREGFDAVEHLKRYTTTGMGTDQGKTSNANALVALADLQNTEVAEIGVTTYRPPFTPLSFGAIVGLERRELFLQKRTTPMHALHDANGAVYEDVGDWKRPFYFPRAGENMRRAVARECLAVRQSVGLLDASTLGKVDIRGPDAVKLLNMVYTNAWDNLAPGKCRYGLMLNEHGMVVDDGVTTCIAPGHYHMTTTTGGAARVMNWLEEWLQTEWPEMRVYCTSVTEQWAVAALNGPNSRRLLGELCEQSLDDESFGFMAMRELEIAGIPARVFRISFTGELAYEINVPARYGAALWRALLQVGEKYDLHLYGTEAMHVLRAEKGFIIVGQDTDGTMTPMDLGMDWIVSKKKKDFLGRRSFARTDTARAGRKQLVGLLTQNPKRVLPEGAHVVEKLKTAPPMKMLGHVTSSYLSPNVGRSIALAAIQDGRNRIGETLQVSLMNGDSEKVTLTKPVFL